MLVATELEGVATRYDRCYIPLTEFDLSRRGPDPNRSWTVLAPAGSRLLRLRYLGAAAIEAWVGEPRGEGWSLARYVGGRGPGGGDAFARLASRTPIRWPMKAPKDYYIANSFEPLDRTFVLAFPRAYGGEGRLRLVDAAGRVLKTSAPNEPVPEWAFRVRDAEVPGGKAAWEPLACSGSRKLWLLRRKADAKVFLLRR